LAANASGIPMEAIYAIIIFIAAIAALNRYEFGRFD
jgi:ribose/xylose/arabinose/galactoside ABC-type transport system permease subunit